ncbi:hypothetical protein HNP69_000424 [Chryseobacterium koreense]|nr:hypothetical protein [Chryseobacterium koreense]
MRVNLLIKKKLMKGCGFEKQNEVKIILLIDNGHINQYF